MAAPSVSVIIPVHNAVPFLREAVESILQQTYLGKIEVCVWKMPLASQWAPLVRKARRHERLCTDNPPSQISVYDDMSRDGSLQLLSELRPVVEADPRFTLIVSSGTTCGRTAPSGPGYARNQAIRQVCVACAVGGARAHTRRSAGKHMLRTCGSALPYRLIGVRGARCGACVAPSPRESTCACWMRTTP